MNDGAASSDEQGGAVPQHLMIKQSHTPERSRAHPLHDQAALAGSKRQAEESTEDYMSEEGEFGKKKKKRGSGPEKFNEGLRYFSLLVMQKVQNKSVITYQELVDELTKDLHANVSSRAPKNVCRRVYDAINVLFAMDIIAKD